MKKLTVSNGNILPKIEFNLKDTIVSYNGDQRQFSPSYLTLLVDTDGSQILTSEPESDGAESNSSRPRKRQRLDHLSQEEKIMRRKLKNRVAAQTARDRKKARMVELEQEVAELKTEKRVLLLNNIELQNRNAKLEQENAELKLRLSKETTTDLKSDKVPDLNKVIKGEKIEKAESRLFEGSRSFEHAEGTGSANSYSLDDAIRLLTSNSETDDLLDLLQQCSEDLMQFDLSNSLSQGGEAGKCNSKSEMVGTPSKSLESHKELIHFDHIYSKQGDDLASNLSSSSFSVPESELSTKEVTTSFPETETINTFQPACIIELVDSSDIPVISITDASDSNSSDILHFDQTLSLNNLDDDMLSVTDVKNCPSPVSSDAGYDSSFSASSPCGNAGSSWDETLTELFPSLV